ncbi:MAG TPA: type II secretion system protein [Phycisphaerales bacterium]|nr:type II secretion system protein [Phycisphaerales bacterium]
MAWKRGLRGFTLIELLVVIAVIGLLLAILVPALRKAKKQAQAVICRSHLHQWSLCFALYADAHEGRFMPGIDEDWDTARYSWIYTLIPYYDNPAIRLCPAANRTRSQGGQLPWVAWDMNESNPGELLFLKDPLYKIGSYGINWWVNDSDLAIGAGLDPNLKWRRVGQRNASQIPVLADAGFMLARPRASDDPPPHDGFFSWAEGARGMDRVCTNRHDGGIHILFMDWSSRKVGLRDLWRQPWHREYVPQEHEWPEWMQQL